MAKKAAEHGRHIFIYNHIWTNQVLYSLNRALNNNQVLKQIPFAGKKTVPAALRKDAWRPLLSVTFPNAPQGLHAFRRLREYRKLHELSCTKPVEPKDTMIDLENPYVRPDTRRPPKKIRSRLIMDQKANSIADLATVLQEQETLGLRKEAEQKEKHEREDKARRDEMARLWQELQAGALPELEQTIVSKETALNTMKAQKLANDPAAPRRRDIHSTILALRALRSKHAKMLATQAALSDATDPSAISTIDIPAAFFPSIDANARTPENLPKRGALRKQLTQKNTPVYSTSGVTIRWTAPLDAEFAETWPVDVRHEYAGFVRHVAPAPHEEPVTEIEELPWVRSKKMWAALAAKAAEGRRAEANVE